MPGEIWRKRFWNVVFPAVSAAAVGSTARPSATGRAQPHPVTPPARRGPNTSRAARRSVFPDDAIGQLGKLAERNTPSRGTPGRRTTPATIETSRYVPVARGAKSGTRRRMVQLADAPEL